MKRVKKYILLTLLIACNQIIFAQNEQILFDFGWKFNKGECKGAEQPTFNDSQWDQVDLPHDWSIEGPFSLDNPAQCRGAWLPTGKCAYRKSFNVKRSQLGRRFEILFEGAYRNSEVWINGNYLGMRPMGYIAFHYDMTPYIKAGENVITVKLDNSSQPGSRWYSGTGIYRHVYLNISEKLYIPTWGSYIVANRVEGSKGILDIETTIKSDENKGSDKFVVKYTVLDADGAVVTTAEQREQSIAAGESKVVEQQIEIEDVRLWNALKDPYLYTLQTEIIQGRKTIFESRDKVGVRTMEYSSEKGFKLNGEVVKIKGACLHHDGGALGAAVYRRSVERQLEILKEMGVNAIRVAHNPSSEEFLDVCDSMGFLVMAEIFDEWKITKKPGITRDGYKTNLPVDYYGKLFDEWSDRDITDWLLHDRNHASIFMWSIGNEIDEMKKEEGYQMGKHLAQIVHSLDYRPTTNGVNGYGWNSWPNAKAVSTSDVLGYNYIKASGFDIERESYPTRCAIVTECSAAQSFFPRGEHLFGEERNDFFEKLNYEGNFTVGELESNKLLRLVGIEALRSVKERDHIMGMFIWTGFDYLGEVTPFDWPARSSSFAPIDLCGFPKDGYYIYQSQWSDKPMVHIYPHWNYEGHQGESIPLTAFTNGRNLELFVNGKSWGRQVVDYDGVDYKQWYVPYEAGEIRIVSYVGNSQEIFAEKIIRTAAAPAKIELIADRETMRADSQDLIYIECNITDKDGNFHPTADNMLEFSVSGEATLIGVDNGDNRCHESFKGDTHTAFNGKCLAIIKSTHKAGDITVRVRSAGLEEQTIKLQSKK
ncbi:MAG: glycoside hydrolase family 2 TIM barrel-domain containing protein [Rikenellaceae bacterium]